LFFTIINSYMRKYRIIFALLGLAWGLSACGAKPAMEGAKSDSAEYGTVSTGAGGGASGSGDSTSFGDENVEKVDEYVIRPGDNLWNIAAKASVYHSGWLYPLIVKANKGKNINPKDLKIGMTLKIPRGLPQGDYDTAREEAMAGVFENEVANAEATYSDSVPTLEPTPPASKHAGGSKKGGWAWLVWVLLLGLAAAGAWQFMRMRREGAGPRKGGAGERD
jgi:hypothetical protein